MPPCVTGSGDCALPESQYAPGMRCTRSRRASKLRNRYASQRTATVLDHSAPDRRHVRDDIIAGTIAGLVSGLFVGVALFGAQKLTDDARAEVAQRLEDGRAQSAERLENLRFVRGLSPEELQQRPLNGLDLAGMDLSGLDLSGADLTGVNLSGARLVQTLLVGTILDRADLRGADFTQANLNGAQLDGADISGTTFRRSSLRGAYVESSGLSPAVWTEADLTGAHMSNIDLSATRALRASSLLGTDFEGVIGHVFSVLEADDSPWADFVFLYCSETKISRDESSARPDGEVEDCRALYEHLADDPDSSNLSLNPRFVDLLNIGLPRELVAPLVESER